MNYIVINSYTLQDIWTWEPGRLLLKQGSWWWQSGLELVANQHCDWWCEVKCLHMYVRDELDAAEYTETRSDTLEQLREFGDSLSRMKEGNLSLVDDLNRIQLVSWTCHSLKFSCLRHCSLFSRKSGKVRELNVASVRLDKYTLCVPKAPLSIKWSLSFQWQQEDIWPKRQHTTLLFYPEIMDSFIVCMTLWRVALAVNPVSVHLSVTIQAFYRNGCRM